MYRHNLSTHGQTNLDRCFFKYCITPEVYYSSFILLSLVVQTRFINAIKGQVRFNYIYIYIYIYIIYMDVGCIWNLIMKCNLDILKIYKKW